jgi:flagellar basal body-associated protein FliL
VTPAAIELADNISRSQAAALMLAILAIVSLLGAVGILFTRLTKRSEAFEALHAQTRDRDALLLREVLTAFNANTVALQDVRRSNDTMAEALRDLKGAIERDRRP